MLSLRTLFAGLYKLSECKCGTLIPFLNYANKPARFKQGHNSRAGQTGPDNNNWKGGRRKDSNGYWMLCMPDYPSSQKSGYVPEHVYFYQEYYKVCICKWAEIHHIIPVTKDYCNNMPWNLKAVTKDEHRKITHTIDMSDWFCSDCNSKETYIKKNNGRPFWYNDWNGGHRCHTCQCRRRYKQERLKKINDC